MKRLLFLAAIAALVGIGAVLIVWQMRTAPPPEPERLPPLDYTQTESWSVRPQPAPPAVWEGGWAIDVILLNKASRKGTDEMATALSVIGPVYAPTLRRTDFQSDASRALQQYLDADNKGRAFIIASDQPLPATAQPVINSDPMVRARFGGILLLDGQSTPFEPPLSPGSVCSDRFGPEDVCAAPVEIRRASGEWVLAGDGVPGGVVVDGFLEWLEASAPKMAQPLGALEEIEIIDIRRPGQTDD